MFANFKFVLQKLGCQRRDLSERKVLRKHRLSKFDPDLENPTNNDIEYVECDSECSSCWVAE